MGSNIIGFCFGIIAVAMSVMGLFTIFKSITDDSDEKIKQAFKDGLEAGLRKRENDKSYISEETVKSMIKK